MPYYNLHFSTLSLSNEEEVFYIPTGSSMDDIAEVLNSKGIIENDEFLDFSEKLGFDESNIEPGKYSAQNGMKIKNLIYGLK